MYLSDDKQADIIDAFITTSIYLDGASSHVAEFNTHNNQLSQKPFK